MADVFRKFVCAGMPYDFGRLGVHASRWHRSLRKLASAALHLQGPRNMMFVCDFNVHRWQDEEDAGGGSEQPRFGRASEEETRHHELQEWAYHNRLHDIRPQGGVQTTCVPDAVGSTRRVLHYVLLWSALCRRVQHLLVNNNFDLLTDHTMLDLVLKANSQAENTAKKSNSRPRCRRAPWIESAPGQVQQLLRGKWRSIPAWKLIGRAGRAAAVPNSRRRETPFDVTLQDLKRRRSHEHDPWQRRFLQQAVCAVERDQRRWRTEELLQTWTARGTLLQKRGRGDVEQTTRDFATHTHIGGTL